jgi:hypothetical protein
MFEGVLSKLHITTTSEHYMVDLLIVLSREALNDQK